jgi:hypothetical protein
LLVNIGQTFSLTVFAEEWWIADDAVKRCLHLGWELDRLFKIVMYELLEDSEAVVYFKKFDLRSALVLSRRLFESAIVSISFRFDSPSSFSTG